MSFTKSQEEAIKAEGDVIVLAGAGTGKTRTMVARCLDRVIQSDTPTDISRILMVTFTEAAASEMKERIRAALQEQRHQPENSDRVDEQLALLDTAKIGTLHSVALELIREFCHELNLSTRLRVLSSEESYRLAESALSKVFEHHYEHRHTSSKAICTQIQRATQGNDRPLRSLIHRIHLYVQSLPSPGQWLQAQIQRNQAPDPDEWNQWIIETLPDWIQEWQPQLKSHAVACPNIQSCSQALEGLAKILQAHRRSAKDSPSMAIAVEEIEPYLLEAAAADQSWPKGSKTKHRKHLESFFADLQFLSTLIVTASESTSDPIDEDWNRCRTWNLHLLQLAQEFACAYQAAKTQLEAVDFQDLEQWALTLLYSREHDAASPIALTIQERFDYVFVDEYQDINGAQDAIIRALCRPKPLSNLFIVGDIKQSIYGFRRANPEILRRYQHEATRPASRMSTVYLQSNFRSHPSLLKFVNEFCSFLSTQVTGFEYGENAQLLAGRESETEHPASDDSKNTSTTEVHLLVSDQLTSTELTIREAEAHVIAQRIRQLVDSQTPVNDNERDNARPIQYSDIAILMRSLADRTETFARVFAKYEIPVHASSGRFFDLPEINDLIALLKVIDNPLQDIPLLALLRSPFFGFTPNELAIIRLTNPSGYFWHGLIQFNQDPSGVIDKLTATHTETQTQLRQLIQTTHHKAERVVESYEQWIRSRRTSSIATQIEEILAAGFYQEYVSSLTPSRSPRTQIRQLIQLTRDFERQPDASLSRFLKWIDELKESEHELEPVSEEASDAVQLMTIHKSKGLEFPVVILADLSKRFNFTDLSQRLIIDEQIGLCPILHLPNTAETYPSLPHWISRREHRIQLIEEEARLLYVALTRAKDRLFLFGQTSAKQTEEAASASDSQPSKKSPSLARSFMDWLAPWIHSKGLKPQSNPSPNHIQPAEFQLVLHYDIELPQPSELLTDKNSGLPTEIESSSFPTLNQRLSWSYPYSGSIEQRAKGSISSLEKLSKLELEISQITTKSPIASADSPAQSSARGIESGLAYHRAFQFMRPSLGAQPRTVQEELQRLEALNILTSRDLEKINVESIVSFWNSEAGQAIRSEADRMHRELPFTARFLVRELDTLGFAVTQDPDVQSESVILQGVVDLAIIRNEDIWILDFKSEAITRHAVSEQAAAHYEQMAVYSLALSRIYRRPVTQLWIHFLTPGVTVRLETPTPP